MPDRHPDAPTTPLNRDLRRLRSRVRRLGRVPEAKLDDAICDVIDLKGLSVAVLLAGMPGLEPERQKRVAVKIEDFLFFHPGRGRKLLPRLLQTIGRCDPACHRHLVSAFADVANRAGTRRRTDVPVPAAEAAAMLAGEVDLVRQGKAVEILAMGHDPVHIPAILDVMKRALKNIDQYAGFHFIETALFALRQIGGDSVLRLMVNPSAPAIHTQFRLEWQNRSPELAKAALNAILALGEDFAGLILKVVDLAEFNLPFLAMIQEGMNHPDKWVRQMAVESMSKIADAASPEQLGRMLNDPAPEVRLMAVSSLGGCPADRTGTILAEIAGREQETYEIRMNALYALFSQKNRAELEKLAASTTRFVALHATGLASMLQKREDGLERLLETLGSRSPEELKDMAHYILELARPEDVAKLLEARKRLRDEPRADAFFAILRLFLEQRRGPALDKALAGLPESERRALNVLETGVFGSAAARTH
ncbi:MAG TPA: HEAT repeat domain-containing protein [Candidatus Ozemobacteraceae bacterium]|nr:HEAT repeat domain-containing protein [Candidatus Ozemobacteraceae bacterium]